jgi:catechol 2,3-dioxygenase-like lactoylglutathione lyase family enzyme
MTIDHISLPVTDYDKSKAFFLAALEPLGYVLSMEFSRDEVAELSVERTCGLGVGGKPDFWLWPSDRVEPHHIAFLAPSREAVDAFHAAAVAAGATDNGAPGLRPQYHPRYYGAFVLDPDGNNIEAVVHD